jgi:tetratricopeptide (TPR) repeat protein
MKDAAGMAKSAEEHRKQKDYDTAIKEYDQAIAMDPTSAEYYRGRAQIWFEREKYDEALEDLDKAIKTGTDDGSAQLIRAIIWRKRNRNHLSIQSLEAAVSTPTFKRKAEAYELLGKLYDEQNDKMKSARNYGLAAQELRQAGDLDKAMKFYNMALTQEEARPKPNYDWLAQTAEQAGMADRAANYRSAMAAKGGGSTTITGN